MSESGRTCWSHRHITWHSDFNFARTIKYEKTRQDGCRVCGPSLTVDHKRDRVISKQCLEMFQRNPDEFLYRFITMDETWIHYFTSKKEQSKQWTSPSEPALNKAKTIKLIGKMTTVFWDARGIIHIDYLSSKQTINTAITTQFYWTVSTTF